MKKAGFFFIRCHGEKKQNKTKTVLHVLNILRKKPKNFKVYYVLGAFKQIFKYIICLHSGETVIFHIIVDENGRL